MKTAQITRKNIGQRPLAMSVRGITDLLKDGQVLHCMHVGAVFLIVGVSNDVDPWPVADRFAATKPTFVIEVGPASLKALSGRRRSERWLPVADSNGTPVAQIRVHNDLANPITAAGRVKMDLVLASTLKPGDTFCDGTTEDNSDAWAVFTADNTTAGEYLPGRLVFKI